MFNVHRRQGALILIAFVLFAGQCYLVIRKYNIHPLPEAQVSLIEPFNEENFLDKEEHHEIIQSRISTSERYHLIESYAHDTLSDIDPPFKRILFWNEVNHRRHIV